MYRDTKEPAAGATLLAELGASIPRLARGDWTAFLLAAEIECALADRDAASLPRALALTDALARGLLSRDPGFVAQATRLAAALELPNQVVRRIPEGYAFYALDPSSYAELARRHAPDGPLIVIGVRSIGTSLSALVLGALLAEGRDARRFTVRPSGHPFERRLEWSQAERRLLASAPGAGVLVVDEGPGLSGSTLLAVAEALLGAGVSADRIRLLASHQPDFGALRAPDATRRFSRFQLVAPPPWQPPEGTRSLAGGLWRRLRAWQGGPPPCWPTLERVKFLSADGRTLLKFCGYPPYGRGSERRAELLAHAGWAPVISAGPPGYLAHAWLDGRAPQLAADRAAALPVLADYLSFRARAFTASSVETAPLEEMMRVNVREGLGRELAPDVRLEVARPVEPDNRLLSHEWVIDSSGRFYKTDGADHASDHLLPGAVDSAWDVAGAIVEWRLGASARAWLLERYRARSGDDVERRLPGYLVAYASFRLAYATYAESSSPADERPGWRGAKASYARALSRALTELSRPRATTCRR